MTLPVSSDTPSNDRPGMRRRAGFWPRRERLLALLVVPAVLFVLAVVLVPAGRFLMLAVDNSDLSTGFAETALAYAAAGGTAPDEAAFGALVRDLARARAERREALVAQALNQRLVGTRFLVIKTAKDAEAGRFRAPFRESLLAAYPEWARPEIWRVIARDTGRLTDFHLLASYDLARDGDGRIAWAPPEQAQFLAVIGRTIWISAFVAALCAVLALPLAQAIVSAPPVVSRILLTLVLFPLWSSLLVRTVIWIIVLQSSGPVNAALAFLGLIDQPLSLIYTRFSLSVAMVQVLLPLMVLSVVSVMKRIPPNYMRAALSLGAPWHVAWLTVQLPLILPGLVSGAAIVFVFALGYYVTPMLVGGPKDQMISSYIAFYTNQTLNWNMAAALSLQLMVVLALAAALFGTVRAIAARRTRP